MGKTLPKTGAWELGFMPLALMGLPEHSDQAALVIVDSETGALRYGALTSRTPDFQDALRLASQEPLAPCSPARPLALHCQVATAPQLAPLAASMGAMLCPAQRLPAAQAALIRLRDSVRKPKADTTPTVPAAKPANAKHQASAEEIQAITLPSRPEPEPTLLSGISHRVFIASLPTDQGDELAIVIKVGALNAGPLVEALAQVGAVGIEQTLHADSRLVVWEDDDSPQNLVDCGIDLRSWQPLCRAGKALLALAIGGPTPNGRVEDVVEIWEVEIWDDRELGTE